MRVTFYDVKPEGRWPLIAKLAEHALARGKKMLVHCQDAAVARELDEHLWTFRDDAFVPHEVVGPGQRPVDAAARIVLVHSEHDVIDAQVLVMESPTSHDFARGFESVIDVVDHRTPELLQRSRARFAAWREAGVQPDYRK